MMRARSVWILAMTCTACGQPFLHPVPWQPFLTAPGAALGRVWTDPTPRLRDELWVNVPSSEPYADSLLVQDFERWARVVRLSRDSIEGAQPPGKYNLRLGITRARQCPPHGNRCAAALRDTRTHVYWVIFETCAGWPCSSGHLVSVRDTAGRFTPAVDLGGFIQ